MDGEINNLYRKLKKWVQEDRLGEISSEIIEAYKLKNYPLLERYASCLDLEPGGIRKNRLFSKLIRIYHPDRYNAINSEIDHFFRNNDVDSLKRYERVFAFEPPQETASVEYHEDYDIDGEDFYQFGMDVVDEEYSICDCDEPKRSVGIDAFEALQRELCGDTKYTISPFDLHSLDGELDLSDYGIANLDGIEGLVNITSLNLSGNMIHDVGPLAALKDLESLFLAENRISDIEALGSLSGLREIDLSFNDIEKADVLLDLDFLEFVNLVGNGPKKGAAGDGTVEALRKKNVIVIY